MAALNLSDLKTGHGYPLENTTSTGKCLIHMKLTDLCTKSIDALINSNRGAVFSLRFSDSGGSMVIPVDDGEPKKFQFKTTTNQSRSEGQNILECVHQASGGYSHRLSCTGPIEHRLTVQGTDHSFKSTKEKMKEAVLKRMEGMAQEISLPTGPGTKGRTKKSTKTTPKTTLKAPTTIERTTPSPTFRRPPTIKPPPPKTNSSAPKSAPGGVRASSHTKPTAPIKVSLSVRERVIHFLALKPQKRDEVLSKIRRETKKSESSISAMVDAVLSEVSEVSSGNHKLKSEFYGDLQIEEWPHYNDAERQLVRRKYGKPVSNPSPAVSQPPVPVPQVVTKRVLPESEQEIAAKKPKLEPPPQKPHPLTITKDASKPANPSVLMEPSLDSAQQLKVKKKVKKVKVKKKKLDKANPDSAMTSDPSSTTSDVLDFKSEFPPIRNDQERTTYKQTFNNDYTEYIQLKDSIDLVSGEYQRESATLYKKLQSLPKHCREASDIRKLIRAKYSELQQNMQFVENKRRFQELHDKLDHIKKQVMEYDRFRGTTL